MGNLGGHCSKIMDDCDLEKSPKPPKETKKSGVKRERGVKREKGRRPEHDRSRSPSRERRRNKSPRISVKNEKSRNLELSPPRDDKGNRKNREKRSRLTASEERR